MISKIRTIIIAGLGNPGREYERTRHNCGFRTIAELEKKLGMECTKKKFDALYAADKVEIGGKTVRIVLLKPQTYMNESGIAVKACADFYKAQPQDIIVVYDDTDIDVAALRIRKSGSAGTHNGMKSVVAHLGTENFPRVRVGIGKRAPNADMVKFVLGTFSIDDEEAMKKAFAEAADACTAIVEKGIDFAMNKYNSKK